MQYNYNLNLPLSLTPMGNNGDVLLSGGVNASPQWQNPSILSTGGCLPTQISNQTWSSVDWLTCGTNCASYAGGTAGDGGFTDWRMPTVEEYTYARQQFAAPTGGWLGGFIWTRDVYPGTPTNWIVLHESAGGFWNSYTRTDTTPYCRCVR